VNHRPQRRQYLVRILNSLTVELQQFLIWNFIISLSFRNFLKFQPKLLSLQLYVHSTAANAVLIDRVIGLLEIATVNINLSTLQHHDQNCDLILPKIFSPI